jgi:hypothetical protein
MADDRVFWEHFRSRAPALSSLLLSGQHRTVFEEIDRLLEQFRLPYCFDVTHEKSLCYFILSPEGDPSVAVAIDQLVMSAPPIANWRVFGRRQRKPLHDACAIIRQLYLIDPLAARFRVLQRNATPFIQMFLTSSADLEPDEQRGLINTFLWHAIGEDTVLAQRIGAELLLAKPPSEGTLSAAELVQRF